MTLKLVMIFMENVKNESRTIRSFLIDHWNNILLEKTKFIRIKVE